MERELLKDDIIFEVRRDRHGNYIGKPFRISIDTEKKLIRLTYAHLSPPFDYIRIFSFDCFKSQTKGITSLEEVIKNPL